MSREQRVVVIADMHCGHRAGLTPRSYHRPHSQDKFHKLQVELWKLYEKKINALKPIDILIVNADCIDGRGERSGSRELITTDRREQVKMAVEAIELVESKHIVMTYGTGFHVGRNEDWEDDIADAVKADKIGGHEFIDVNGLLFDIKHKVGSSTIPHGRFTAIAREKLWNVMWTEKQNQESSDVIVRSHVHYFGHCGDGNWLGITTPALQGMGSIYGTRECSGVVDWGFVWFDIWDRENYAWKAEVTPVVSQRAEILKL
jgi:hypothetical protein